MGTVLKVERVDEDIDSRKARWHPVGLAMVRGGRREEGAQSTNSVLRKVPGWGRGGRGTTQRFENTE